MKFDCLSFSGGIINRFYSNKNMIQYDFNKKVDFKFKDIKDTISEENVNLNGENSKFQFSVMEAGWKDDGIITFGDYDSILKIKYETPKDYKMIIKDLNTVDKFFKFSANRNDISVDKIFLEVKNNNGKYEKTVEVIIPYMVNKEINKDLFDYTIFKSHLNEIFEFLDNCDYIFSIIPDNNRSFEKISNKEYCAIFSCFESIYKYVHYKKDESEMIKEEIELEELKEETLLLLRNLDDKYKGKNKIKRKFLERFNDIISSANLNLEKKIINELKKRNFLIDTINYKIKKIEEYGMDKAIQKAVKDRDYITHNNTVRLDSVSIGIYEMLLKLNFVMILDYIGISNEIYEKKIKHLSLNNII